LRVGVVWQSYNFFYVHQFHTRLYKMKPLAEYGSRKTLVNVANNVNRTRQKSDEEVRVEEVRSCVLCDVIEEHPLVTNPSEFCDPVGQGPAFVVPNLKQYATRTRMAVG
jgi:hypothetical protein